MAVSQTEFYKRYCRVCGSNNGICVDLFTEEGRRYLMTVQKLLNINIDKMDRLPKNICHSCISLVHDFSILHQHCNEVQLKLKDLADMFLPKEPVIIESPKNFVNSTERDDNIHHNFERLIIRPASADNSVNGNEKESPVGVNLNSPKTTTMNSNESVQLPTTSFDFTNESPSSSNELNTTSNNTNTDNWTVTLIHETNTKLYMCKNCPDEILLSESAIREHLCKTDPNDNCTSSPKQLPLNENADLPRRKRIINVDEDHSM